ncbi:MAG: hypothetical protein HND40_00135 [Ignavibacteriota bacterium]|nr:hypothetical protein [Ignavibacteriota bacterium]MCO6447979.1 hypothetical protein [Ignavibacterium album]MCZ2268402.1 hypothetical protein [Ignavibacteriales bacterium]QKJ98071.1 MAG: hypothetical protein HND40_00135 [Ignavibacteriota bacterium]HOJ06782.1 hypothetical protein [Ignavibacteriaceae bacterium]
MKLIAKKWNVDKEELAYYIVAIPESEKYSQKAILSIEKKILELTTKHKLSYIIYDCRDNPFHKILLFSK